MNNDFIYVVPARKGSKGIKEKNLIKIKNKPLIVNTFKILKKIKKENKYVVSNDLRIKKIARKFNINDSYFRPEKLSGDKVELTETLKDFSIDLLKKIKFKYIVILQPTSPLRTYLDVKRSTEKFLKGNYSSLFSISPSAEHPNESVYIENKKVRYFFNKKSTLRQNYKPSYFINGAIYISNVRNILKKKIIDKKNHGFYVMKKSHSIDIDDKEDLIIARKFIN